MGIEKAIKAISQSNPSMIELLYSSICYISDNDFHKDCLKIVERMHNNKSLYYHYLNMAKKNWKLHIIDSEGHDNPTVLYKKYLYVLRPLLMTIYIQSPGYDEVKKDKPIINNFSELLDTIRELYPIDETKTRSNHHPLNPMMLLDLSIVIQKKITDKTFEGPCLKNLNQWIHDFFNQEEERDVYNNNNNNNNGRNEEKKETAAFQTLNGTKCKLEKEIDKINLLSKNKTISRNDYLSLFNQYLLFTWIIQHPDNNNVPSSIIELLDQVTIDEKLKEWIRKIMITTEEFKVIEKDFEEQMMKRKMITETALNQLAGTLRMIESDEMKNPMLQWIHEISHEFEETGKLPSNHLSANIIDWYLKGQLSLLWLLKNEKGLKISPDILAAKEAQQIIPKELLDSARRLLNNLRLKYACPVNHEFHRMIQADFKTNSQIVESACEKNAKKKGEKRQEMYKDAMVKIPPKEFIDLLGKYY